MITTTTLANHSSQEMIAPHITWGANRVRRPEIVTRGLECGSSFDRALCGESPTLLAENADVRGGLLMWPDLTVPFTLSDGPTPAPASYVFSPVSHYIHYSLEEVNRTHGKVARLTARAGLGCLQSLLAMSGADRVLQLNSWLVSTNLHPTMLLARLNQAVEACVRAFPDHLIMLRNVHEFGGSQGINSVCAAGFKPVASRKIYFFDGAAGDFATKDAVKRDRKLWKDQTRYRWVSHEEIELSEAGRILALYQNLYIQKHSRLNLRYTEQFVRSAIQHRWLDFRGLRNEQGVLDGVLGILEREGIATTPFVGYDTAVAEEAGLYRRLVSGLHQETLARKWTLNFSSGAGEFKRRRGGQPVIESTAFYWSHLPLHRQVACTAWAAMLNSLGAAILRRSRH